MTNIEALKALCNAIANTFYPDDQTMRLVLFNASINPSGTATAKDPEIFMCATKLIFGYIEGSRSENGISTSVRADDIKNSIRIWCGEYGLDADDVLSEGLSTIEDITSTW